MMELVNEISGSGDIKIPSPLAGEGKGEGEKKANQSTVIKNAVEALIILLSPFAPHICDELWLMLGNKGSVINIAWPQYNEDAIKAEEMLIVIQINGKVRGRVNLPANTSEEDIKRLRLLTRRLRNGFPGKI